MMLQYTILPVLMQAVRHRDDEGNEHDGSRHAGESGVMLKLAVIKKEDRGVPYQEKGKWIIAAIARIVNMPTEDIPQESYLYRFLEKVVKS